MANCFEGFDPQGDLEYVKKVLGEGNAKSLREKLGIELPVDIAEVRDEDDGGWGESDPIPASDMAPVGAGEHSAEDADSIPEVIGGGPTCGTDADAPAVGPFPDRDRAADSGRVHGPEGEGPVPDPVKPSEPVREPTRVPPSSKLSPAEERAREIERWWGFREKAMHWQVLAVTDELEQLIALGLIDYIELTLVEKFHESVPNRGQNWDENRRQRHIRLLRRRLDFVEARREAPFKGRRGLFSWLRGKRFDPAGTFYSKAIVMMEQAPDGEPFRELLELCDLVEEHLQRKGRIDGSSDHLAE